MKINESVEKKNIKKETKKAKLTVKQEQLKKEELEYSIKQIVDVLLRDNNKLGISYCLEVVFTGIFGEDVKKMDKDTLFLKIKELVYGLEELNKALDESLEVN